MWEKLEQIARRCAEIGELLTVPEIYGDAKELRRLTQEQKELEPVAQCYEDYRRAERTIAEATELLSDAELRDMAQEELRQAKADKERLYEELRVLLLPRDPNDGKNVIMELRGGVGGEESALFAADLYRMYSMYAEKHGWKIELLNYNDTELGGVKEADFILNGAGAWSRLKFESGVHRVQRVPETESGGRVHTSTATVAVLPEMEEVDVDLRPEDIEMQVYRSSGAGGQHVNKTSSAVRLIHKPTGIVVACQEERSQVQNRAKCMQMLASKLYEMERERVESAVTNERRAQVGTGMRNERIRTYNFPQNRVTDPARESAAVEQAADILRRGGLLAIPTETVYGLGADGLNADAVRHIFEAKGRPQDNPLILHIPDASWLARYCKDVPETAYRLAGRFWPGPLTMILPKADCVPLVTTGGLETVGMRCPDHAVTRAIIAAAGVPVAAPSANTSGRPSCTTAAHVREDMDGRIDGVVDGGPCRVGVESTIIDLTCTPPRLLRPGGLPLEELRAVLGEVAVDKAVTQLMAAGERPRAPGMKYRHYAPKAPVTVVTGSPRASARRLLAALGARDGVICFDEFAPLFAGHIVHRLGASGDKLAQSQHVFDALRTFDATDVPAIWAQCPDSAGLGLAVGNRLKKAAGFHTEEADGAFVLGITGGTGAGKTTLLHALERRGALVLDCDAVYHEMLRTDAPLRADLTAAFGDVFAPDGGLDRQKLGNIVFGDAGALAQLDAIIFRHLPRALARRMEESGARLIALDAIKLVESGLGALCDVTVAVTAPEEVRVRRIMTRDGISEDYARARVRAQRSEEAFRADCDAVFENNYPTPAQAAFAAEEFLDTIIKKSKEE